MNQPAAYLKSALPIVKEFVRALGHRATYDIRKNSYCLFGILWGAPIPIVTVGIDLYSAGLAPTVKNIISIMSSHRFHFLFLLHPLLFAVVFGAMGTVRNNKDQKIREFEEDLIRKNKELKELDEMKSNFMSMVSHELRTPLTTIRGYVNFLKTQKSGPLNTVQLECLQISEEEIERLNNLIEELLDLAKIERGEFGVNLEAVQMKDIVEKAVNSLRTSADKEGIALESSLPQNLPMVKADRERIFQVVANLVENGIKFNRPRSRGPADAGKNGKVSISAVCAKDSSGGRVIFCVSDTGIGIEKKSLGRIFDRFYQADSSGRRRHGGCGLGLAISKSILELHNGRIWAESEPGRGSKFFFELTAL